jgi:PTS system fructose-specific IIC component
VYTHKGSKTENAPKKKGGVYGHLMNGVSHMLPFVVAGGIFIAIAFLIDTACGINAAEVGSSFGTVTPVANWFKTLGNVAFSLMVPILAGFIAQSIADRPGLLVGLVGGFMATSGATFIDPAAASVTPSGFLGGLFAGFVGGYMMLGIEKMCDKFPKALEGIKPVLIYPLLGLGGILVLMCAINPIMGIINSAMSNALTAMNNSGLLIPLCALLAGMMAIDMGGPFNKAAYSFATIFLAEGTDAAYVIMAAVMIGGMVPPIAIALSNTFFKNRWTEDERKNAPVNYVMGLSFITEGAIPYAASYPLKVIPSCIVGSAVAGTLSALFGCKLMAPHGGIFVFATMQGTWYWYILALAIGAVVGMLMLAILKRPNKQ